MTNFGTPEAQPVLYGEAAREIERIRLERPHYLGRPLVHSQVYDKWVDTTERLDFNEEQMRQLREDVDFELIPNTWRDFFNKTIELYDTPESAALALNSVDGAASTFLLGYVESLEDDPYIKKWKLDPLIAAKARIEHAARSKFVDSGGQPDLRRESKQLGVWRNVFKQDLSATVAAATAFIERLPERLAQDRDEQPF